MKEAAYKKIEQILERNGVEFDANIREVHVGLLSRMLATLRGEINPKDLEAITEQLEIVKCK